VATGVVRNIRKQVFHSLQNVLVRNQPRDQQLHQILSDCEDSPQSRGFVTELFYGSLQYFHYFDSVRLAVLGKKKWPLPLKILTCMSLYQLHRMDGVPDYAAVNESLKLLPHKFKGLKGALNFLLRESGRNKSVLDVDGFVPDWYKTRLESVFEGDETRRLEQLLLEKPWTFFSHPEASSLGGIASYSPVCGDIFCTESLTRVQNQEIENSGGLVCDLYSLILPGWIQKHQGVHLDLCSSPGGKFLRAGHAGLGTEIRAVEINTARFSRLQERVNYHSLSQEVSMHNADALEYLDGLEEGSIDSVYLDPPCSAVGTIPAHPEYLLTKEKQDLLENVDLQKRLIKAAARVLKPSGQMIYSTCSFLPEEGELHDFQSCDLKEELVSCSSEAILIRKASQGYYCLPTKPGGQYFYSILLRKGFGK